MSKLAGLAVVLIAFIVPRPTEACSLGPGYLLPSNFETVAMAHAVVLAKVTAFPSDSRVTLAVEQTLKGKVDEKTLVLAGNQNWRGASDPEDFSKSRPGSGTGGCIAYDYRMDSSFLLLLSFADGEWHVSGIPFARVNEEVTGVNAPWTRAVSVYVRINALPSVEERKKALRELAESTDIPGVKADIARHFGQPHGSKPFEDLQEMYDRASTDAARDGVLWALANGKHAPAAALMRAVLASDRGKNHIEAIASYATAMRDSVLFRTLIQVAQQPETPERIRTAVITSVADGADATLSDQVLELLRSGSDEEAWVLSRYFQRTVRPEVTTELRRRVGRDWVQKKDLTLKLAFLGDRDVVQWALEEWKTLGEDRWVSVYVLAISPLESADEAARSIIETHPDVVDSLTQGYGLSSSPHRIERLVRISKIPLSISTVAEGFLPDFQQAG